MPPSSKCRRRTSQHTSENPRPDQDDQQGNRAGPSHRAPSTRVHILETVHVPRTVRECVHTVYIQHSTVERSKKLSSADCAGGDIKYNCTVTCTVRLYSRLCSVPLSLARNRKHAQSLLENNDVVPESKQLLENIHNKLLLPKQITL